MNTPPSSPVERFASAIQWPGRGAAAQTSWEQLIFSLIALIIDWLRSINQGVAQIAEPVRVDRSILRRSAVRHAPPARRRRRQANLLPRSFGRRLRSPTRKTAPPPTERPPVCRDKPRRRWAPARICGPPDPA